MPCQLPVCEPLEGRQLLAADLVATEVTGRLPVDLVSGTRGRVPALGVNLNNAGNADVKQQVVFRLYASADGALDLGDTLLVEATKNLRIGAGKAKHVPLKLGTVPAITQGAYRLLAEVDVTDVVVEDNNANNTVASSGTIAMGPPFWNLTATDVTVAAPVRAGRATRLNLTMLNNGNQNAKGQGMVNVVLTPVGQSGGTPVVVPVKINIKTHKSKTLRGRLLVPAGLAPGQYTVTATLGSTLPFTDNNAGDNSTTGGPIAIVS